MDARGEETVSRKTKIRRIIFGYVLPIVLGAILVTDSVIQQAKLEKKLDREELLKETSGIITAISKAGKGSFKINICRPDGITDSVYVQGLGDKKDDILVNDSIVKKRGHFVYEIYRKKESVWVPHYSKKYY